MMTVYMENPKGSTDELLELISLATLLDTEPICKIPLLLYVPAAKFKNIKMLFTTEFKN